ncbi:MAG: hypothetical protein EA404_11725 [Spirochaetaceae bacterium]|nr:MAG: hypothetical protein EA404_11725 [Spirochaetaceae bacterium]
MTGENQRTYYRLRKGKYRAAFYVEDDLFVVYIGKRDEVYRLWELYEDLRDRRIIEEFEVREDAGAVEFGLIDNLV